jgi:ABC-type branched-subunit amino acid transport system substrate-binding protein
MQEMIAGRRWWRLAAVGLAACAVSGSVAACGSDDDKDDGGGAATASETTAAKPAFTGAKVKVMWVGPLKSAVAEGSDTLAAVKAAALAINNSGGLAGHEVEVEACNNSSANTEVKCARKAASDGTIAIIGSAFFYNWAPVGKVLEKAGIPNVASLSVTVPEFSSPVNYPIDVPSISVLACPQLMAASAGAKKISAIAQDLPVQIEVMKTIKALTEAQNLSFGTDARVGTTETDYSAVAKSLGDAGSDTVVNFLVPTVQGPLFTAASSLGVKFQTCASPASFSRPVLKQLGERAGDVYLATNLPALSQADSVPLLKELDVQQAAAAKAGIDSAGTDKIETPANVVRAWLGMQILKQVAPDVSGDLTAASLKTALDKATVTFDGIGTFDFSKPGKGPGFERMFAPEIGLQKWDSSEGDFVKTDAKPVDIRQVLGSLAG